MNKQIIFGFIMLFAFGARATDVFGVYHPQQAACDHIDFSKKMDLGAIMEAALCQNPALKISYLSTQISSAEYGASFSDYLPQISLESTLGHETRKQDAGSSNDAGTLSAGANLSWLLLDFGSREASRQKMKAFLESADFSYNNTLQGILYDVSDAYYSLLSAQEKHEGLLKSEEASKKAYEEASSRYQLGLVPLSDKLQAETAYAQAQLASIVAAKQIKLQQGNMAELLHVQPSTSFSLVRPSKTISDKSNLASFEKLVQTALKNRPDLRAIEKEQKAAEENIRILRSEGLPTLTAVASSGLSDDIRGNNRNTYSGSVGLRLSFPLFTGFSQSYKEGRARFQYEQKTTELTALQNTIQNEVWTALQDYQTSLKTHTISKTLLKSAEESERVAFASYKVGKLNITSLLDAQSQLASARIEYSTSFYNFLISKAALLRALGNMEKEK